MAIRTITNLIDDIDASKAEKTVYFSWEGKAYEIDLSTKNIKAMTKALEPYLEHARRSVGPSGKRRGNANGASSNGASNRKPSGELAAIRAWALDQGMKVSDRGRIPQAIVLAYSAAHSG